MRVRVLPGAPFSQNLSSLGVPLPHLASKYQAGAIQNRPCFFSVSSPAPVSPRDGYSPEMSLRLRIMYVAPPPIISSPPTTAKTMNGHSGTPDSSSSGSGVGVGSGVAVGSGVGVAVGSGVGVAGQTSCHGDRHWENKRRVGAEFGEIDNFSFSPSAQVGHVAFNRETLSYNCSLSKFHSVILCVDTTKTFQIMKTSLPLQKKMSDVFSQVLLFKTGAVSWTDRLGRKHSVCRWPKR